MSYDLFLRRGRLSFETVSAFFEGRAHYSSASGPPIGDPRDPDYDQPIDFEQFDWFYSNPDTGVYFNFTWVERDGDKPEGPHLHFDINYFRPHIFGLEAAEELAEVIAHFGPEIEDPQMHGMGDGPFSKEAFLSGWNAGNRFAHRAFSSQQNAEPPELAPSSAIADAWLWNRDRAALQRTVAEAGADAFIPLIMWFDLGDVDGPQRCMVWGRGVVTALPPAADYVICVAPARPSFLDKFRRRSPAPKTLGALPMSQVRELMHTWSLSVGDVQVPITDMMFDEPPPAARAVFKMASGRGLTVNQNLPVDSVLDAEIWQEAHAMIDAVEEGA